VQISSLGRLGLAIGPGTASAVGWRPARRHRALRRRLTATAAITALTALIGVAIYWQALAVLGFSG
jgi:hypothetical protein